MYKKGSIQLRASFIKKDSNDKLDISILKQVYNFINTIIPKNNIYIPDFSFKDKETNEYNTIDSSRPKECRIQDRPDPYTFKGKCKPGYYVAPWGKKRRTDGLYEPCCYKINKSGDSSLENINKMILNGFPNEKQAKKYEVDNPDIKAAVYYPGTNIRYQRRFKGLKDLEENDLNTIINKNSFGNNLNKYIKYLKKL